jgi:alpha-beta hydrolase superfamily lysophospholipase
VSSDAQEIILEASDGIRLVGRNWGAVSSPPAGNLLIVHGIAEHSGRYQHFADFFSSKGIGVYGFDLRGHGLTAERGAASGGSSPAVWSWDLAVRDIGLWIDFIREENPGLPVFLLGHSLGSFLARGYAAGCGENLAGLILSGTGSIPKFWGAIFSAAAKIAEEINGKKEPGLLLYRLIFRVFAHSVKHRRTRFDWLSRDEKIIDAYRADPFCGKLRTSGFLHDFLRGAQSLRKPAALRKTPRDLPIYLFSGSKDPMGNFSRGVTEVYREYRKAGSSNISMKIYSGGRHEMLNETNRDEVYRDIFAWISARTKPS